MVNYISEHYNVVVAGGLFLLGSVEWIVFTGLKKRLESLKQTGTKTEAEVITKTMTRSKVPHMLTYRFTPMRGEAVTQNIGVSADRYEATNIGDRLEVIYNRDNPKQHVVEFAFESKIKAYTVLQYTVCFTAFVMAPVLYIFLPVADK